MSEIGKNKTAEQFYDDLANEYHLIFADWWKSVRWHGQILDGLIRKEMGNAAFSVLDCTCGIGTQAIGLALFGHTVSGSDLSSTAMRDDELAELERLIELPDPDLYAALIGDTPLDPEYATALFERVKAFRAVDHDA